MGILEYILDSHEQLTLLSVTKSAKNVNSSTILCISALPASFKEVRKRSNREKMEEFIFRRSMAASSADSGGI